jgi:predicted transcriptional regulator
MVRDPISSNGEEPTLEAVVSALDDPDCRTIVRRLEAPMTASELSERCDIPMSTTYRKLDRLSSASLLSEGTELRADGHHATIYEVDFDEVAVRLTEGRELTVEIDRPIRKPEERLASIWAEVRKET